MECRNDQTMFTLAVFPTVAYDYAHGDPLFDPMKHHREI